MPHVTNAQFRGWIKAAIDMKLSSDASVLLITYKELTNFDSFMDSDHERIESLGKLCINTIVDIIDDPLNGIQSENEVKELLSAQYLSAGWLWLSMNSIIIAPLDVSLTTTA